MRETVMVQMSNLLGDDVASDISLIGLAHSLSDYDANKAQPKTHLEADDEDFDEEMEDGREIERVYSPSTDDLAFSNYIRRIEDLHPRYIQKYMSEAIYAACKYRDSYVRSFSKQYVSQATFVDSEDAQTLSESDLLLDTDDDMWSQHEISTAQTRLPYVLKRIHNLSILLGVHMLSFIAAYVRARAYNDTQLSQGSTKSIKVNDVTAEGVYLCSEKGNPTFAPPVSAKNVHIANAFKWYTGQSPMYPAYHNDVINFLHYIDVLNIDIRHDDMKKYDAAFMSSLVVTTITPASQYNPEIFKSLKGESMSMDNTDIDIIDYTISMFRELTAIVPELKARLGKNLSIEQRKKILNDAAQIASLFYAKRGVVTDLRFYKFIDGFLYYQDVLCVIGTDVFMTQRNADLCPSCIISEIGYIAGITDAFTMYGMMLDDAILNIGQRVSVYNEGGVKWSVWRDN